MKLAYGKRWLVLSDGPLSIISFRLIDNRSLGPPGVFVYTATVCHLH